MRKPSRPCAPISSFAEAALRQSCLPAPCLTREKSETAFALASSFGNIGKKVLLVDADIRKSVMVKRYEIKGNPNGLSQYLSGQKKSGGDML